jgi:HD superfamily phosphodiesterase
MLREKGEAYELLTTLVAPDRPVRHAKLVDEATGRLLLEFQGLGVACDVTIVELGAVLHDCGNSSFCRILRTRIVA